MPSGCVGRRISHTSKDPARLFYYLSATQHSVAIGEIFARTALWKHSIQLFHLNYYSFFLKCLCDPSEWQYERSAVLHVLHFHETFDVILFSEFSFSSLHKLSSQQQINMARRQVSKPTGNVHNQMFLAKLLFSLHSPGGFCAQTLDIFQKMTSVRFDRVSVSVSNEHVRKNLTENEDHTRRQMASAMQSA